MGTDLRQMAFDIFSTMKPGEVLVIREFAKKDPAAFIQYGKDFIDAGNNFEFNADYSKFKRLSDPIGNYIKDREKYFADQELKDLLEAEG